MGARPRRKLLVGAELARSQFKLFLEKHPRAKWCQLFDLVSIQAEEGRGLSWTYKSHTEGKNARFFSKSQNGSLRSTTHARGHVGN